MHIDKVTYTLSTLILGGYLDSVSRDIDSVNRKVLPK